MRKGSIKFSVTRLSLAEKYSPEREMTVKKGSYPARHGQRMDTTLQILSVEV